MEYKVVQAESICELEKEVNQMLENGWRPQGGAVFVCWPATLDDGESVINFEYIQAMIRHVNA